MAIQQLRLSADLAYQSSLTRTVAENATSGLLLMNTAGQVTYMNSAGARIIGYDVGSLAGRPLHDVVHHSRPDGTPVTMAECRIWRTVLGEEEATTPFEDAYIRPDGSFYPVRVAAAPVMRDDQVVAVVLEVQDITAEETVAGRLSDLAVSASDRAAKLRGLIQSIGDAVVVCEPAGAISLMNPAAVTLFGPRLTHVTQLVTRLRTQDGHSLEPDASIGGSYLVHAAERETWVEARAFPVPPAAGGIRRDSRVADRVHETGAMADHGQIYVFRDVTASRRAKVMREAFIGMLSHELRTPITTVYGGTKVLARRSEQLLPEVRSVVADIEAESERLFRLVEDLVVLTKSEAATLEAGREPVLLQRVLPGLVTAEARRWPELEFGVECWASMPPVLAEQTYVEQVVRNLLTNAAKYGGSTEPIVVTGTSEGDEVVVRVLDRGPGFPEVDGERLFDIYYRSPHVARRAAGAGIGLFVCKSLVEAMGGRIWARERDEGGAEFGFALTALVEPGEAEDLEADD
jgi:PAS domain S-box-containing protein